MGRTGGVYIPPFKLAQMQKELAAQNEANDREKQKLSWEALRKSINGLINKVNVSNIKNIVTELFEENLVRGRGLFARAIMKAQLASPGFTHIYTALIAIINTKLPENGELILKRVIYSFKRAYKRRDKIVATALAKFIAHLVNHQVAHEILALQLLTVFLEDPTDDSVEIAVNFVKEVGQMLEELSPQGLHAIFERFRAILHEGDIDKRVQYTIENLYVIRKSGFADYPAIPPELDLVEREDQITFEIGLDDEVDKEEMLDIFRYDPNFEENEKLWEEIKRDILGDDESDEEGEDEDTALDEEPAAAAQEGTSAIIDLTEQDLINMRRTIYLTIMSSISFEECAHKMLKLAIPEGYEGELCNMIVECCANERSYLDYYGLLGQRFCNVHRKYQLAFDEVFLNQYTTIHRLETNKLRNVSRFFAHLLATDALPWTCIDYIRLNEDETTSSSRIFIKILMQELAEKLGMNVLRERFSDPIMHDVFSGLFPHDNPRNTRFAINFFTSIGLGGLTEGLREHLKNMPKLMALQMQEQQLALQRSRSSSSSSSSSSDSSSSSGSSSDSSSSSSSDSDSSSGSSSRSSSGSSRSSRSYSSSSSSSSSSGSSTSSSSRSMENLRRKRRAAEERRSRSNARRSNARSKSPVQRRRDERAAQGEHRDIRGRRPRDDSRDRFQRNERQTEDKSRKRHASRDPQESQSRKDVPRDHESNTEKVESARPRVSRFSNKEATTAEVHPKSLDHDEVAKVEGRRETRESDDNRRRSRDREDSRRRSARRSHPRSRDRRRSPNQRDRRSAPRHRYRSYSRGSTSSESSRGYRRKNKRERSSGSADARKKRAV